jgi:hypothetical protein
MEQLPKERKAVVFFVNKFLCDLCVFALNDDIYT